MERTIGLARAASVSGCDHGKAELELVRAMNDSQQRSGRMFPNWREVLVVVRCLGYQEHA